MRFAEKFQAWRKLNPKAPSGESLASLRARGDNDDAPRERNRPHSDELTIERNGVRFRARIVDDDHATLDETGFYGKFTDEFDFPNTLKRRAVVGRNEFKCWQPQEGCDVRSVAAWFHRDGLSKSDAYRAALAQAYREMDRAEAYGNSWHFVGVIVTATKADDECECELADASLWSIESDSGRSYFLEIIEDLIHQCEQTIEADRKSSASKAAAERVTGVW